MRVLGLRIGATNTSAAVALVGDWRVESISFDGSIGLPTVVWTNVP